MNSKATLVLEMLFVLTVKDCISHNTCCCINDFFSLSYPTHEPAASSKSTIEILEQGAKYAQS